MVRFKSEFPTGPERKKLVQDAITTSDEMRTEKAHEDEYSWRNSSLDRSPDGSVPFYETFFGVLPHGTRSLKDYLETVLASIPPEDRIFIEFGGPAKRVAAEFNKRFFAQSFGFTLTDLGKDRSMVTDLIERHHVPKEHTVLEGNLLKKEDYAPLDTALNGKKASLIIERMAKGLRNAPIEPYLMAELFQRWYGYLAEGGVMLIQTPLGFNTLIPQWVELLKKECGDTLEIRFFLNNDDEASGGLASSIFLQKKKGAPDELPMLDPRTVRDIGRKGFRSTHRERTP